MKKILVGFLLLLTCAVAMAQPGGGIAPGVASTTAKSITRGSTLPTTCTVADVYYKTTATTGLYNCTATNTWALITAVSAPISASYITQVAEGGLTGEQALAALSSGIMRVATTTGAVTSLTDSAGIASNISDETGTGKVVFDTSPTIATPIISTSGTFGLAAADDPIIIDPVAKGGASKTLTITSVDLTDNRIATFQDVTGTIYVSGGIDVPVTDGGTGGSAASITLFNNITGYTAAGATGTTSTNLVFSASPTIDTPIFSSTATVGLIADDDVIKIDPRTKGANAFTGNISSADLTADRGWNFPNADGTVALTGDAATAHNLFSAIHSDTVTASPILGDIIYGNVTPAWTKLAADTSDVRKFLRELSVAGVGQAPAWDTVTKADVGLSNVENTTLSTWPGTINIVNLGAFTAGAPVTLGDSATYDPIIVSPAVKGAASKTLTISTNDLTDNRQATFQDVTGTVYVSGGTDVPVTDGGTGVSTLTTAYGLLAAGTTATGNVQTLAAGATTQILVGGGVAALPAWGTDIPTAVTIGGSYVYRAGATDVSYLWFVAAGCNNATASTAWDLPTANAAVPECVTGANTQKGILAFADAGALSAQTNFFLPSNWTSTIDADILWTTPATANDVKWQMGLSCTSTAGAEVDDNAFNALSTVIQAAPGTANRVARATITGITLTGCAVSEFVHVKIYRDPTDGADTLTNTANLLGVSMTVRRTLP